MKSKVIIILLSLFASSLFAQGEQVVISEKKTGKRVVLMAENKTADTLNVFLMVKSEGYRRSADKPVLKDIPPMTTLPMIRLIELNNIASTYSYELIINDAKKSIEFNYEQELVDIENAIRGKIVVFTASKCAKCIELQQSLTTKRIPFQVFNIGTYPLMYRQFMKFIEEELQEETRIKFPIIWNKDHTIFGYDDLANVLPQLK